MSLRGKRGQKKIVKMTDQTKETQGKDDGNLEGFLEQIAKGMLSLQETVGALADSLSKSKVSGENSGIQQKHEICQSGGRSYILNWRELGGSNLTFYPNNKTHPMQFLRNLNKILNEAGVPEDNKINLATNCMRGTAADWVSIKESSFQNYDDFINSFKKRFWGQDKQRELFLELKYGKFELGKRSDYFLNLVNQASFLSQKISEGEIIDMISKHFSAEIRRGIVTQGLCTIDEVEEYLRKIDETYTEENQTNRNNVYDNRRQENRGNNNRNIERRQMSNNDNNNIGSNSNNYSTAERRGNNVTNNNQVNLITRFNESTENILYDPEYEEQTENHVAVPVIQAIVSDKNTEILVDSGSEVSAVSETFFEAIKTNREIPVLPVAGVQISVAVGGKLQRVKYQSFLTVQIKDIELQLIFLIIPKLNRDVLLGCDFLTAHKAQLNFNNLQLSFTVNNLTVITDFDYKIMQQKTLAVSLCEKNIYELNSNSRHLNTKHYYSEGDLKMAVSKADIGDQDRAKLFSLLESHRGLFSECPGRTNVYEHEIVMKDDSPFYVKSYPIPFAYRSEVEAQLQEMLDWGIISPEKTEYVSPLVTVTKKDKSVRVCLDARILNSRMNKDYIPPPNVSEILMNFRRGQVVSTIDLTASYWQVPIKKENRKFVGFLYQDQTYIFNVLPFGLSTSMASLIRCLNKVLGAECSNYTICYVDDLLIFSENIEIHLTHLNTIFEKLKQANLTIKLRKCQFFREQLLFLGHIITKQGICMDPSRVEAISKFPVPRNVKELRGFLGLVNYEQRFCENHASLSRPLLELLKKGVKWHWGVEHRRAIEQIKQAYLETTMLAHPNLNEKFYIECDSSGFGLGGCLYQLDSDTGEKAVIAYTSRVLKGSELNYTVSEKETLAIVHCLRQWRTIILGRPLVIITDHKSLTFLLKSKLRNARLIRWAMFIQEFDFLVVHCGGVDNVVADSLSRYPLRDIDRVVRDETSDIHISLINLSPNYRQLKQNFKSIRDDQLMEESFKEKFKLLGKSEDERGDLTQKESKILEWFILHEGILFKRGTVDNRGFKLCVPTEQRIGLIKAQHEELGHFGKSKVYEKMKQKFYWPRMQREIRQYVASCELCQKSKPSKRCVGLLNPIVVEKPGELVCLDLMGPLPTSRGGVTVLLVMVDAFSKFVQLYPLKRATTKAILNKIFGHYIPNVQKPKAVLSDNGSQFTARRWKGELEEAGIKVKFISVYFPQGNLTERYNREIGRLLRCYCHEKHTKWAYTLDFVENCLNQAINDTTGYSPLFLQTGQNATSPIDNLVKYPEDELERPGLDQCLVLARNRLQTKAAKRAFKANECRNPETFKVGDQVLVRSHKQSSTEERTIQKFFLLYEGPFRILRQAGPNSYIIADDEERGVAKHNIINMKRFKAPIVA